MDQAHLVHFELENFNGTCRVKRFYASAVVHCVLKLGVTVYIIFGCLFSLEILLRSRKISQSYAGRSDVRVVVLPVD